MRIVTILFLVLVAPLARAEQAGAFDYYVMSLSWSPNWCELEGDARGSDQCDTRHDYGWILHGLWPQYERGYPRSCQTVQKAPTRRMTAEMADIMGTSGLAWHQWKKHGTCTGLTAAQYFALSREAYGMIARPEVFRRLTESVRIAPEVVENAFLQTNPELTREQITITCKSGHIQEARICLTKGLELRDCGQDVRKECSAKSARFTPVR